ncbi:MAG: hypothetical protein JOZ81_21235 [Chloroflexi bacterium]|nr:hypothetical protein [Chloroflexota bacterium]
MRKGVKVSGVKPLHWRDRTAEDIEIGAEAWVSLDGETALPARVTGKDDRHYDVQFECTSRRSGVYRRCECYFFLDEVRTTPELACINMVTM